MYAVPRRGTLALALAALLGGVAACQPAAAPSRPAGAPTAPSEAGRPGAAPGERAAPAATDTPAPRDLKPVAVASSSRTSTTLPQLVGMDYGIFHRWGFDVESRQMQSSIAPAALIANQLDYFTGVDSSFRAAVAGMPIKIAAVSFKSPVFGLMARPDLQTIPDLRGKVRGVSARAGAGYYAMKRILDRHGMTMNDIEVLVVGDSPVQLQQLLQGTIDFVNLGAPLVFEAQDRGYRMLAYVPDQVNLATTGLVVSDEAIQTRREEIRRMIAATVEANRFIHANREQAIASMVKHLDVPWEHAAQAYDFSLPALTTDPRVSLEETRVTIQEELEAGHVQAPPPPERVVAFDLTEEALALLR
jgi:NitT/TauT family transport system substrate-binding protein